MERKENKEKEDHMALKEKKGEGRKKWCYNFLVELAHHTRDKTMNSLSFEYWFECQKWSRMKKKSG